MTDYLKQERVANLVGALSHLLTGSAGRTEAFIDKFEVCVSGRPPLLNDLLSALPQVEANQRPLLWVHPRPEVIGNLQIALASPTSAKRLVAENCVLWMAEQDDRVLLVPGDFRFGAFRCDDSLALNYYETPLPTLDKAVPGMLLAYTRLEELAFDQLARGEPFPLPQRLQAA